MATPSLMIKEFNKKYGNTLNPNANQNDIRAALKAADAALAGNPQGDVSRFREGRNALMEILSAMSPDQMDTVIREGALAGIRLQRKTSRAASFVTGPRGIEGPLANLILGGGTSMLGS